MVALSPLSPAGVVGVGITLTSCETLLLTSELAFSLDLEALITSWSSSAASSEESMDS